MEEQRNTAWRFGMLLIVILGMLTLAGTAHASVGLTTIKDMKLTVRPLDVAVSSDGKHFFVLAPGQLLVYSLPQGKLSNRITLNKPFDRLTYSENTKNLILTSSTTGSLRIIRVKTVYAIDISGCPFKGPADAPVTLVVFDDYQ